MLQLHLNAIRISSIVSVLPTWFWPKANDGKETAADLLVHHQYELTQVHLPIVVHINLCHDCVHLFEKKAIVMIEVIWTMVMSMVIMVWVCGLTRRS